MLDKPIEFSKNVGKGMRPICLPKIGEKIELLGKQVTTPGWGLTDPVVFINLQSIHKPGYFLIIHNFFSHKFSNNAEQDRGLKNMLKGKYPHLYLWSKSSVLLGGFHGKVMSYLNLECQI